MTRVIRPGILTTEFWLALAVCTLSAFAAIYVESEWAKVAGLIAATLASAGYSFARKSVKQVETAGAVARAERSDIMKMQAAEAAASTALGRVKKR